MLVNRGFHNILSKLNPPLFLGYRKYTFFFKKNHVVDNFAESISAYYIVQAVFSSVLLR
jgi:hypothetical protein